MVATSGVNASVRGQSDALEMQRHNRDDMLFWGYVGLDFEAIIDHGGESTAVQGWERWA